MTRNRLFTVLSSLLMVFAVSTFALAQEATTKQDDSSVQQKEGKRGFGRHGGRQGGHRGGKFGGHGKEGFGKGMGHRGGGMRGGFHMLNLSEEQKGQLKTLHENFRVSNEASFKEFHTLRQQKHEKTITAEGEARLQALKQQMKSAHEGLRASAEGILTAEQKTQLETKKAERKQKMEERKKLWEQKKANKPVEKTTSN